MRSAADDEEIDLGLNLPKGDDSTKNLAMRKKRNDEADADDEDEEPVRKGRGKQPPAPKPGKAAAAQGRGTDRKEAPRQSLQRSAKTVAPASQRLPPEREA